MDKILQQFLAIAETGSFSQAANSLFVTQPTLTFNMKKLEESLGVPLLTRSSKGTTLTPYGETLFENARMMRRLYDNTLKSLEAQRIGVERGLSIGTGYSWWFLFLRDLVFKRNQEFPTAPLHVSFGNQLHCMDQLLAGEISLFLGHEIPGLARDFGTNFIPLARARLSYFARPGHLLLDAPRLRPEILAFPQVLSGLPETRHRRLLQANSREDVGRVLQEDRYVFASNSLSACIEFALNSDAVCHHATVMKSFFLQRGLCEIELRETEVVWETVGIYVPEDETSDKRVAELITEIKHAIAAALVGREDQLHQNP
ncbi:LysR family transcriptional regulator [Agrobacterium sp. rho-13.3]|uniref:LysR family transcriptional regulator n=1 Tax=Agrobacterium sp. rho-13.3 TaxID=3072980 RepID=UPI002A0B0CAD|nr:LysR family transcriptional regulator [Agrobacterium sp. rho-13.3]MDX8308148.1 LysR family transcriptional regulator [Agrobacterium sp. rho-13.3]